MLPIQPLLIYMVMVRVALGYLFAMVGYGLSKVVNWLEPELPDWHNKAHQFR